MCAAYAVPTLPAGKVEGQTRRPLGTTTRKSGSPPAARNFTTIALDVWRLDTWHGATFATALHCNKMNAPAFGADGCETLRNGVVER